MRLAVVHNLTTGGAHRRLAEQVAAFPHEVVEFTTSAASPVTARPYLLPLTLLAPTRPALLRPPLRVLDLHRLSAAWRALGDMAERCGPDAIFVNPDSILRGAMPIGRRGVPVIRYCDEPRRIDYEPAMRASLNPRTRVLYAGLRRIERRLDRAGLAEAGAVTTNSRYTAAAIARSYGRSAEVLPCGAPEHMTPGPPTAPVHLLSVGSLIRTKGHDLVIEAAALSGIGRPVVVVAPADVPGEGVRLRRAAERLGVRLTIRIGVTDAELVDLYRSAFATLYLAAAEPLGLVSLEAQACGSPVIVAGEGGLPETVEHGRAGLVVPRTAAAAGQALSALSRDGRRDDMANAARASANGHGWRASARGLADLVDRCRAGATAEGATV